MGGEGVVQKSHSAILPIIADIYKSFDSNMALVQCLNKATDDSVIAESVGGRCCSGPT